MVRLVWACRRLLRPRPGGGCGLHHCRGGLAAAATAAATTGSGDSGGGRLVREFVHDSLYHATEGYFHVRASAVGRLPAPIHFGSLLGVCLWLPRCVARHSRHPVLTSPPLRSPASGRTDYDATVAAAYRELDVAWLTPSELLRPHYGSGASFIAFAAPRQ